VGLVVFGLFALLNKDCERILKRYLPYREVSCPLLQDLPFN